MHNTEPFLAMNSCEIVQQPVAQEIEKEYSEHNAVKTIKKASMAGQNIS